jgi:AraC family transcriptional regulator
MGELHLSQLSEPVIRQYDLKRDPVFHINNPFHSVHFYFPRVALNAIADNAQAPHIDELHYQRGAGVDDRVMRGLAQSLLPAFEHPEQANRLFVEQVTLAVGVHTASTYGGMKAERYAVRGGLAPWQEKRAIEMLDANLGGETPPPYWRRNAACRPAISRALSVSQRV